MKDYCQYSLILLGFLDIAMAKINIIDLKVPSAVENGSKDELILDCDFEAVDEEGIEVKWFYDDNTPIYQWIPNVRKPQALGNFKDRIDLSFKASNDSNTMYRALRIKEITPDLSGDYTCKITSYNDEAYETKKLIIYEPVKEFEFIHIVDDDKVICTANGVFPRPDLSITIIPYNGTSTTYDDDEDDENVDDNDTDAYQSDAGDNLEINDEPIDGNEENDDIDDNDEDEEARGSYEVADDDHDDEESKNEFIVSQNEDDTYNLTRVLGYKESEFPGVTKFICELSIPDTTYSLKRSLEMYSGVKPPANDTFAVEYYDYNNVFATNATNTIIEENGSWDPLPNLIILLASATMILLARTAV